MLFCTVKMFMELKSTASLRYYFKFYNDIFKFGSGLDNMRYRKENGCGVDRNIN